MPDRRIVAAISRTISLSFIRLSRISIFALTLILPLFFFTRYNALLRVSALAVRQERLPVGWQMLVQSIEQHGVQRVVSHQDDLLHSALFSEETYGFRERGGIQFVFAN